MNPQYYGQIENGGSSYESSFKSNPIKNPSQTSRIQSSHTGNSSSNNYAQYDNNQNFKILKRPSQTPYRANSNEMSLNQFNYSPNPRSIDDNINVVKCYDETSPDVLDLKGEIDKLSFDEKKLIYARYYEELTQSETSSILGMSQVQVSRNESKILKKLRNNLVA